jgi:thiamine biosynthesis lipoprotein ApbE
VTVVFLGDNHSVGLADALATGLSVLPIEQGLMVIRSLKNAYALFLVRDSNGQIKAVMTQGLDTFYRRVEVRTPNVNPVSP